MTRIRCSFAQIWIWLLFVGLFSGGCTCTDANPQRNRPVFACEYQQYKPTILSAPQNVEIVPGAMNAVLSTDGGNAALSLPFDAPPGRAGIEPSVSLQYNSGSTADGIAGVGFVLRAGSSIQRCAKSLALDSEVRSVLFDDEDAFCLDGKRLVQIAVNGKTIEYRTIPDTQVKVIGYFNNPAASHFEAFLPNGTRILYGTAAASRPMANTDEPQAWLAEQEVDPRGNAIQYDYCFANDDSGYTAEYALTTIRYAPDNVIAFKYAQREDVPTTYMRAMQLQQSLQLAEVQMQTGEGLARRYAFTYETSETTGRALLQSVQECAADGSCYAPTQFHYAKAESGFDDDETSLDAPLSNKASPMLFDVDHDGLSDYVVGDSTPLSTPDNPITEWRIARNIGGTFAQEHVALLQEGSFTQDPQDAPDPTMLQPEMGTALDFTGGTNTGLFLHDLTGARVNHSLLVPKADMTFELVETNVMRPFPNGPSPSRLRSPTAASHLIDVSGDAMGDLIVCGTPTTGQGLSLVWNVHLWQPGGFAAESTPIPTLEGIPCNVSVFPVDIDQDAITDLIVPGYVRQGGVPTEPTNTYSVHRRRSNGEWEAFDTRLQLPRGGGRVLFLDVNGDGLPDAVQNSPSDGRLLTFMNTGLEFAEDPQPSLKWDLRFPQDRYFYLAQALDYDGDHRSDLLLPMVDDNSPSLPRWVILHATGGRSGFTFEQIDTGIPFEPTVQDAITLADPRGPRVCEVNGDGASDVALFLENRLHIFKNRIVDADVLVGFSDGTNDHDSDEPGFIPNVSIAYEHLTNRSNDSALYQMQDDLANDCVYPRHCAVGARRVVKEVRTNDGTGGESRIGYRYRDGRYDRVTRQWLGFGKVIRTDLDTGATTVDFYDNVTKVKVGDREVYPFIGQVQTQWQWTPGLSTQPSPNQVEMVFANRTFEVVPTNGGQSYFTLPTRLHTRRMQGKHSGANTLDTYVELVETLENATMLRDSTMKVVDFDAFGNVLEVQVDTVGVDATTHVTQTVKNDLDNWRIGLPDTHTECGTGAGLTHCRTITRTTNAFGEVETESTSSNDGMDDTKLTVSYQRDDFGNITKVLAKDAFDHHREQATLYDDAGLFPTKRINGLQHETRLEYDRALGILTKETDPNGLVTERQYDGFGRLTSETRPDGSQTTITRTREKIDSVWRTKERVTTTGGDDDEVIYDGLGRPIATFTHGPAPKADTPRLVQTTEYDARSGNVAKKSVPFAEGSPNALFDTFAFDALGREIQHVTPWNAITTTTYDGFLVDVTEPLQTHTITKLDALGRAVTITDAEKGVTRYTYGPFDALRTVTDPGSATTEWTRDAFGRVRQLDEPDRGTTHYVNDGFGDVVSSTDALGRTIVWVYDALGRASTRTDTHAGTTLFTTWTWDMAPNGIGALHSVVSPDAAKTYGYSARGQLESVKLGVANDVFAAHLHYDDVGRVKQLDYPQPLGEEPFGVTYEYDAFGHRKAVRDATTSDAYWELTAVDDAGRPKEELFGNGVKTSRSYDGAKQTLKSITTMLGGSTIQQLSYDWNERLNLKSRTDALQPQNKTERFRYDGLERLTCTYFSPAENAGAPCATLYGYASNGNLTAKSDVGTLSYTDTKHPHAVTNAAGDAFMYNAVGSQIGRPGGVAITYTPFDLPKAITKGAKTTTFGYDGDQQRIRKTTSTSETLYFEDLFEQVETGASKEFRYYVFSPERVIAIVTHGGNDAGTKWLHPDHLGSIESVTNEKGVVTEKRSYDPFGQRRNVLWGMPPPASFAKGVKPGFTGHDEEDEFGLIDMKGRLFDPRLGRFTTTDPVISNVFNGQTLNGFSYVANNPLTFIDPSGFSEEEAWRQWRVEETGPLGIRITFDKLTPPRDAPAPAADVGVRAPTHDVGTTGEGGNGSSASTPDVEPIPARPGFGEGVWDGVVEMAQHLPEMVPDSYENRTAQARTVLEVVDAYKKGDAIDAINVVNPLMGAATLGFAIDDEDWYAAGRASVGVGVAIVGAIVGKKLAAGTGAGTTRGPPTTTAAQDHHLMTNKNLISSAQGGPWTPMFENMARKAGMTLEDAENRVRISGHSGPHPRAYHQEVFKRLDDATKGLRGEGYSLAFREELARIRIDAATPGSRLHQLITR